MNLRLCLALAICVILFPASLMQAQEDLPVVAWEGRTMGSPYTVKIVGFSLAREKAERLRRQIEDRLAEINRQMSHYEPESEISRFNAAPAQEPFKVSPEFADVMRFTLRMCERSNGALDPTLAPVINLWGFGEKSSKTAVPSENALQEALAKTGYKHLTVTSKDELVKHIPDLTINLSAVAKGFAVDEMVRVLKQHGYTNVYASIAGEVRVLGHNQRRTKWQIGISSPISHWRENNPMAAVAALSERSISTSGDYQKFFYDDTGRRLSHIFDPRTGRPVQHTLGGVSVVALDSMTADALSTTLFVLGPQEGVEFIDAWTNAAALFVIREPNGTFRTLASKRFQEMTGYSP